MARQDTGYYNLRASFTWERIRCDDQSISFVLCHCPFFSLSTYQVQGLTSLFGDYLTRCLYSKTWSLREAAILKIKLLLPSLEDDPGINNAIAEICQVLRVGCEDKIAQVKGVMTLGGGTVSFCTELFAANHVTEYSLAVVASRPAER